MIHKGKPPSTALFLAAHIVAGLGINLAILLDANLYFVAVMLITGVGLSSLWYGRRIRLAVIVLTNVFLVQTTARLGNDVVAVVLYHVGLTGILIVLSEAVGRVVTGYRESMEREAQANRRLHEIMNHNPALVYALVPDSEHSGGLRLSFVGDNAAELLGRELPLSLNAAESVGLVGRVSPTEAQAWRDQIDQVGEATVEYSLQRPDGQMLWLRDSCRVLRSPTGHVREIIGHVIDVSRQRQISAEMAERDRQLNEVVRNSPAVLYRGVPDPAKEHGWLFTFNSANAIDVLGYSAEELQLDQTLWFSRLHSDDRDRISAAARQASLEAGRGGPVVYDYRFQHRDGHLIWLQDTLRIVPDAEGRPKELFGQSLDITDRYRAEAALAENRRQLDEAVRHSPALVYRAIAQPDHPDGWNVTFFSSNTTEILGYTPAEMQADPALWLTQITDDDRPRLYDLVRRPNLVEAARSGPIRTEFRYSRKDGQLIWLEATWRVNYDAAGEPIELFGQTVDISSRKAADLALTESRRFQDESVRNSPAILFQAEPDPNRPEGWRFLYHSANTIEVLGYTAEEFIADPGLWLERIAPVDQVLSVSTLRSLAANPMPASAPLTFDYRFKHKAGHEIWLQNNLRLVVADDGSPVEMYGQAVDITARKLAEQALRDSRQQQDEILRNSPAALFRAVPDPDQIDGLKYVFNTDNTESLFGLSVADLASGARSWIDHIHPEDRATAIAKTREFVLGSPTGDQSPLVYSYRFRHGGDGHQMWLQYTMQAICDEQGRLREVVGQNLDVTAQKRMELALAEANERMSQVLTNSPILSYSCVPANRQDNPWDFQFISPRSQDILGMEPDEVVAISPRWLDRIHPADRERVTQMRQRLSELPEYRYEFRFQRADGQDVWLNDFGRALRGPDGQVTMLFGHLEDITVQRTAVEALRQAEARLHHIVSNSPMATYTMQAAPDEPTSLRCTFITENIVFLTGYSDQEFVEEQDLWMSRIHPDDRERVTRRGGVGQTTAFEYRFTRRDGVEVWLEDTAQTICAPDGSLVETIGQVQDVTERKRAQMELEESQRFVLQLTTAIPSNVLVLDVNTRKLLYVNRPEADLSGRQLLNPEESVQTGALRSLVHPDDLAEFDSTHQRIDRLADEDTLHVSLRIQDNASGWRDLQFRHRVFRRDATGRPAELLTVWDDVTEARRAERALAESQRLLSRMTEAMPSSTYVLNIDAAGQPIDFAYVNRYLPDLLGYTDANLDPAIRSSGTFLFAKIHPEDRDGWIKQTHSLGDLRDGQVLEQDFRVQAADGSWHWFHSRILIFQRDDAGRPTQLIGVLDDITITRQAQDDLAVSQRLLNRVAQTVPSVLYVFDFANPGRNGGLVYNNRSLSEMLGYQPHLEKDEGWLQFVTSHLHPEDWDIYLALVQKLLGLSDGDILETEYRLRDASGNWRWMLVRNLVFERNAGGMVTQIIGLIEDITASKVLQNEVRAERDFAQLVLSALGQGVAVFNPDGLCEFVNPAGARILGLAADAAVSLHVNALAPIEPSSQPTESRTLEFRHGRSDGQSIDLLTTVTPRIRDDVMIGSVVVFTDVTDRKAMEYALSQSNLELEQALLTARELAREAQAANRAKSDFLANMSHEIRTPMNAIVGLAELLLDAALPDEQRSSVQLMIDSGQALLDIINDILDFSKIEAGRLELDLHDFNATTLVEGAVDLMVARARQKGVRIACRIDPAIPETLRGDSGRLRQILLNLLSNAIKFAPGGDVHVMADLEPSGARVLDHSVQLRLTVKDTGIGISPEALRRLFQPFEQAESGTTRRYGGTGLGLAIVKRLLDIMDARIELDSTPGVGTTATIVIPLEVATGAPHPIERRRRTVLVIEPDAFARKTICSYVEAIGYDCESVTDPAEALAALRLNGREYMAVVVGLWASYPGTQRLLETLTIDLDLSRLQRIVVADMPLEAPFDQGVLLRPIKRAQLTERLELARAGGASGTTIVPVSTATSQTDAQALVLLAEDNPVNQKVALLQLAKLGFSAEVVSDGRAALETYILNPDRYQLILMDCQMPVLDGFEATRAIRTWEEGQPDAPHAFIIAMTANAMAGDREQCLAAGMDDYLAKPVNRQALRQTLDRWSAVRPALDTVPLPVAR